MTWPRNWALLKINTPTDTGPVTKRERGGEKQIPRIHGRTKVLIDALTGSIVLSTSKIHPSCKCQLKNISNIAT
jgi:hypothetical protein